MAQPTAFPIALYLDGTDRTTDIPYDSLRLDDKRLAISELSFRVEGPSGYAPAPNMTVRLLTADLTKIVFDGFISDLRTVRRGVVTDYEVTASDRKVQLQKAVVKPGVYTGDISTILDDLLGNAFPDLSDDFNIDVDPGEDVEDLSFELGDENLLEALSIISDSLGADLSIDPPELTGSNSWVVTFDTGGETDYTLGTSNITMAVESGRGLPDPVSEETSAWYGEREFERTYAPNCDVQVTPGSEPYTCEIILGDFTSGDNCKITDVEFDYKVTLSNPGKFAHSLSISRVRVLYWDGPFVQLRDDVVNVGAIEPDENDQSDTDVWKTIALTDVLERSGKALDFTVDKLVRIEMTLKGNVSGWDSDGPPCDTEVVDYSVTFDNFKLFLDPSSPVEPTNPPDPVEDVLPTIDWGPPDSAPFDLDVGASDVYFDELVIDVSQDDFNAVVVTGGTVKEAIDWTYESDGEQNHFDLELPISDYTIYRNNGTDASPVWDAITAGIRGKDELFVNGGTVSVLYDAKYHWLEFGTNPDNLAKAFRVVGFIEKAIRIAVDETEAGEPTFAMPLYDATITTEDSAVQRAKSELDKRNGPQRVTLRLQEPGIYPGMTLSIVDSARGVDTNPVVQRVSTKWLGGSGHAIFDIEAGPGEELSADQLIAQNDKRSREKTPPGGVSDITTIGVLLDDSSNELTDDDDRVLYEVT